MTEVGKPEVKVPYATVEYAKSRPSDDIEVLENRVFMLIPVTFDAKSMLDLNACAKLERFIKHIKEIPSCSRVAR